MRLAARVGKWLVVLCSSWLAAQIVTDIVRQTAFRDLARGWSNIGMTIVYLVVLWTLLSERPRRIVLYGWGLVLGSFLTFFVSPTEYMVDYPWKFGIAYPATFAVFLIASRKECQGYLQITLSALIGVINIAAGTRNLGGACLAAALYLAVTRFIRRRSKGIPKLKARSIASFAALTVLGLASVFWIYQFAATRGILGEDAREKYEVQASGRYGMLLGGRVEILGSLPAIYDSPILGHGSFARDPTYLFAAHQALAMMDYQNADEISGGDIAEGYIPTHSYIFGAWVSAGILGALFWGSVWFLTVRTLARVYPSSVTLLPMASFAAFALLWDVLFSPYGAEGRIISPYYIVMLMTCLSVTTPAGEQVLAAKLERSIKPASKHPPLRESTQA
jgi:hypothetical protein